MADYYVNIHMHTHPKSVLGCILLLDNITEDMFANQVGEIDFTDKVSLYILAVQCQCF